MWLLETIPKEERNACHLQTVARAGPALFPITQPGILTVASASGVSTWALTHVNSKVNEGSNVHTEKGTFGFNEEQRAVLGVPRSKHVHVWRTLRTSQVRLGRGAGLAPGPGGSGLGRHKPGSLVSGQSSEWMEHHTVLPAG